MSEPEWYYTSGDERCGPVNFTGLKEMARGGELDPRKTLVWSRGMLDWAMAGDVEGLFSKRNAEVTLAPKEEVVVAKNVKTRSVEAWKQAPSGAGRLSYLFATSVIPLALSMGLAMGFPYLAPYLKTAALQAAPWLALSVLLFVINVVVTLSRLKNLGMSRWWIWGFIVPPVALWLMSRCFAGPPGYALSRKLDAPGWILAIFFWSSFLGLVTLEVLAHTKGDQFPRLKQFMEEVEKNNHRSVPWQTEDGAKPAAAPVKK